jgi:hypothetical protein
MKTVCPHTQTIYGWSATDGITRGLPYWIGRSDAWWVRNRSYGRGGSALLGPESDIETSVRPSGGGSTDLSQSVIGNYLE